MLSLYEIIWIEMNLHVIDNTPLTIYLFYEDVRHVRKIYLLDAALFWKITCLKYSVHF